MRLADMVLLSMSGMIELRKEGEVRRTGRRREGEAGRGGRERRVPSPRPAGLKRETRSSVVSLSGRRQSRLLPLEHRVVQRGVGPCSSMPDQTRSSKQGHHQRSRTGLEIERERAQRGRRGTSEVADGGRAGGDSTTV